MGKQKIKFLGGPRQIYHIGRKSFPFNVWIEITHDELKHFQENKEARRKFDFDPAVDFDKKITVEEPKPRRRKKEKEDK
jgi:hypothetical protein